MPCTAESLSEYEPETASFPSLGVHQPEPDVGLAVGKKLKDPIHGAAPSALTDHGIIGPPMPSFSMPPAESSRKGRKSRFFWNRGPGAGPWTLEGLPSEDDHAPR
ncbi:hypothetical protein J2790_001791 [Paenarthrobacter nicotinovorans]|nr:hypothetical protein [Paenarthrobacter nicotinovorans]SCZ56964.1 hypothetical protein SAMN02799638_02022 [Arthrobacter sp. UNCCL28]